MTVKELRKKLLEFPDNLEIVIKGDPGSYCFLEERFITQENDLDVYDDFERCSGTFVALHD